MSLTPNYLNILSKFELQGNYSWIEPYGIGHINETYAALYHNGNGVNRRYLLQRINHHVFKKPEEVMVNIDAITQHLREKIAAVGGDPNRETLNIVLAKNGRTFYRTASGDYWRVYDFIENATTYQVAENLTQVENAAKAFGNFQRHLDDFPTNQLHETIVDFHHSVKRFEKFNKIVNKDRLNRAKNVQPEIDFVHQREAETAIVVALLEAGELPLRVTHNDTKFNNVMIDNDTGKGICVVDLDTVMPGSLLYDFGDAIRSIANTAEEDQPDLSKVHFDIDIFETYASGYLTALQGALTSVEMAYLAFSARLMTLECGMRFLTDYLDGDMYFKIQHPTHNLDRCRTQFKLVREMEHQFDRMQRIVEAQSR